MRILPSKGKLALIGAAGLMAVLYSKRQQRADRAKVAEATDGSDESLASLVTGPGASSESMPKFASSSAPTPTAENPYPPSSIETMRP